MDFIDELPDYDVDLFVHKKMKTNHENSLENLKKAYQVLSSLDEWNDETVHKVLFDTIKEIGIKNGQMLWPIRTAPVSYTHLTLPTKRIG